MPETSPEDLQRAAGEAGKWQFQRTFLPTGGAITLLLPSLASRVPMPERQPANFFAWLVHLRPLAP